MNHPTFFRYVPAMVLGLPMLAAAQPGNDPANAAAPAQPLRYESAFADYKPWQDLDARDWRQVNDDLLRPQPRPLQQPPDATPAPGHQGHQQPQQPQQQEQHHHHQHGGRP